MLQRCSVEWMNRHQTQVEDMLQYWLRSNRWLILLSWHWSKPGGDEAQKVETNASRRGHAQALNVSYAETIRVSETDTVYTPRAPASQWKSTGGEGGGGLLVTKSQE